MPTAVSITSAIHHKKFESIYKIYVLTDYTDNRINEKYKELNKKNSNVELKVVNIHDFFTENVTSSTHVSKISLLKFYLPYIFPNLNKALYLDSDTIVRCDLTDLYKTNLEDNYAGVVWDYAQIRLPEEYKLHDVSEDKYFNSGVMIMNLEKIREDKIPEKLLNYRLNGFNHFMDQDALNKVFYNNTVQLPWFYNFYQLTKEKISVKESEYYNNKNIPKNVFRRWLDSQIVHFTDKKKPWLYNRGLISLFYQKYYKKSPYAKD